MKDTLFRVACTAYDANPPTQHELFVYASSFSQAHQKAEEKLALSDDVIKVWDIRQIANKEDA